MDYKIMEHSKHFFLILESTVYLKYIIQELNNVIPRIYERLQCKVKSVVHM